MFRLSTRPLLRPTFISPLIPQYQHQQLLQHQYQDPKRNSSTLPQQALEITKAVGSGIGNGLGEGFVAIESVLRTLLISGSDYVGWGGAIVLSTFLLRAVVTLPLYVHTMRTGARTEVTITPLANAWQQRIKGEIYKKYIQNVPEDQRPSLDFLQNEFATKYKAALKMLKKEHKSSTLYFLWPALVQIPLWISMSLTIRRLAGLEFPFLPPVSQSSIPTPTPTLSPTSSPEVLDQGIEMIQEQTTNLVLSNSSPLFLVSDLSLYDPTWTFPLLIGASYLINIEIGNFSRSTEKTPVQKAIVTTLRMGSIFMIFVAKHVPMALGIYWASSGVFSLIQNFAFCFPKVRRTFFIPQAPSEKDNNIYKFFNQIKLPNKK